jgi:hypothetical protein
VILSCGPLATWGACQIFCARPDLTVIDQGSTWDPETRDVEFECHKGTLKHCPVCN